jgi:hypothetical protein
MSASFAPAQKPAAPAAAPLSGAIASHPDWPKAKPADVDSVDHILAALYDVISGPANQARDWVRFRSLFVPDARLIPVRAAKDSADVIFLSVDGYIARASAVMESEGFYEHGTHNQIEQFNDIVHIFSTYESRHAVGDAKPFARGINSIQLVRDGARYWIVDVFWDSERPDAPIPPKYLPTAGSDATHLNQNLTGEWVGQLEYRDFQSNERVFLPTWLSMTPSADGRAVQLAYVYDDGPTKTVRETSTLTLLPEAKRATLGSDAEADTYAVAGLEEFAKLNRGTLVLTGPGKENDKPVDVRITLTLRRNLFTLVKETKPAGEDFKFRDGYTFTRASAPSQ